MYVNFIQKRALAIHFPGLPENFTELDKSFAALSAGTSEIAIEFKF